MIFLLHEGGKKKTKVALPSICLNSTVLVVFNHSYELTMPSKFKIVFLKLHNFHSCLNFGSYLFRVTTTRNQRFLASGLDVVHIAISH